MLDEVLSALIPVNENGRPAKITKLRALLTQMVNKGLKGHHPSANLIISQLARRGPPAELDSSAAGNTDEEARTEFDAFLNEIRANLSKSAGTTNPQNDDASNDSAAKPKSDGKDAKPKDE